MFNSFLMRPGFTSGTRASGVIPAASPVRTRWAASPRSMGLCSMSMIKKSRPADAMTSTSIGLPVKCIIPITSSPRSSLRRT